MKLYTYLFILLCTYPSIHAMEGVELVPYDFDRHAENASRIYKEAFPNSNPIDEAIRAPRLNPYSTVTVAQHGEKLCGFIIYDHNTTSLREAFYDVWNPAQNIPLRVCNISRLVVSKDYQGRGIGSRLMNYAEERARDNNDGIMTLISVPDAIPFYKKQGFRVTKPCDYIKFMAKPLDQPGEAIMHRLLNVVIQLRSTDRYKNKCFNLDAL